MARAWRGCWISRRRSVARKTSYLRSDNGPESLLGGGAVVVRAEWHWNALHRPGVPLAERDRGEFQRSAAGRAALIGNLRHAGSGAVPDQPVTAALQPSSYPAGAWQGDAGRIRGDVLPDASSAPARCGTAGPRGEGFHAPTVIRDGPMRATQSGGSGSIRTCRRNWGQRVPKAAPLPAMNSLMTTTTDQCEQTDPRRNQNCGFERHQNTSKES